MSAYWDIQAPCDQRSHDEKIDENGLKSRSSEYSRKGGVRD